MTAVRSCRTSSPRVLRVGVAFPHGQAAGPDPVFQLRQPPAAVFGPAFGRGPAQPLALVLRRPFAERRLLLRGQAVEVGRVAEVEEGLPRQGRIPQHAMQDLQGRHAVLGVLAEPRLLRRQFGSDLVRHPAVPFPQQADEVGAAAIDLGQADRQHFAPLRLLLGDPPPQVHFAPGHTPLLAQLAEPREDAFRQFFAFRLHVAERRRNEHPEGPVLVRRSGGRFATAAHAMLLDG